MDEEEYEFSYGEDEEDKIYINLDKRLTTNELVFHDFFKAMAVAKCLMEEDYCVMISREEKLVVLNFVETIQDGFFPRNQVYFNSCYELEDEG